MSAEAVRRWDDVVRDSVTGQMRHPRGGPAPFVVDARRERRSARRAMARVVLAGRSVRVQEITTSAALTWAVDEQRAA